GCRDNPRVGGIDTVDVRIDLAEVGFERGGQSDRRQIGSPAPERGDLAVGGLPLDPGHDDDLALVEQVVDLFWSDVLDFGFRMYAVGDDASLGASERSGGNPERM